MKLRWNSFSEYKPLKGIVDNNSLEIMSDLSCLSENNSKVKD
jgi:hypothetical protein